MSEQNKNREQYARFYKSAVKQAKAGNRDIAKSLISDFADLAVDPNCFDAVGGIPTALIQHIASCLNRWKKLDFQDADRCFDVARPDHRPDETTFQHARAMRAYLLLRARAKGVIDAISGAARYSDLTQDQVRYMLAKDKPAKAPWFKGPSVGVVGGAALLMINKRLHNKVLNPPRKKYQRRP